MSASEVMGMMADLGIPCVEEAWQKGKAPALPWAVYTEDHDDMFADGHTVASVIRFSVEYYSKTHDREVEREIKREIESRFGPTSPQTYWIESESCFETVFDFTQIERYEHEG